MSSLTDATRFLAQVAAPAQPTGLAALGGFLPMILIMGALYFIMIAPQRKKQKELEKMLAAITTGDEVITTAGIYGTITNVKDDRFVVRIADNTKIELGKAFVQAVIKKSE
ncbi:MAG: preprotein translocase subunit YajC [Pseudomonadota bacterium]